MEVRPDLFTSIPAIEALVKETAAQILSQSDYVIQAKGLNIGFLSFARHERLTDWKADDILFCGQCADQKLPMT